MKSVNPNLGENKNKAYQLDTEYMRYILYPEGNNGYRTMLSFRKEVGACNTAIIKIRGGSYNVALVVGDTITYSEQESLSSKETPDVTNIEELDSNLFIKIRRKRYMLVTEKGTAVLNPLRSMQRPKWHMTFYGVDGKIDHQDLWFSISHFLLGKSLEARDTGPLEAFYWLPVLVQVVEL